MPTLDNYATATPPQFNQDGSLDCLNCEEPVDNEYDLCALCTLTLAEDLLRIMEGAEA